jgi:formylglycine-generating enzyme required for sulfatase activity
MVDETILQVARIPAGEFAMGSEEGDDDERPPHVIYIDDFCLGTFPVTNAEYAQFINETGHRSPGVRTLPSVISGAREIEFRGLAQPYEWTDGTPPPGRDKHPVTLVSIDDAVTYCAWLASKTGKPIRLPTEAEWEKAARGGYDGKRYPWGDTLDSTSAHFLPGPERKTESGTAEVGRYAPNGYQLFDMAGNVWEWVLDWYSPTYYASAQYLNPQGPDTGLMRVVRGGSWVNADERYLRCAHRHKVPPDSYSYSIGFRIAYSMR